MNTFEAFNQGALLLPEIKKDFSKLIWNRHPSFEGVELKHIVTSNETNNEFSCHLVRIAPNKSILNHIHENQTEIHEVIAGIGVCINHGVSFEYKPGSISVMPKGIEHEVTAGEEGLYLFAKFFPALC